MTRTIGIEWLAEHLNDPNLVIIDASPTEEYLSGHIENAVSASFSAPDYLSYGINTSYGGGVDLFQDPDAPIPFQDGPPEYISEVLRSLGIKKNSTVIVYDNGGHYLATRLFWTLTFHGHENSFILDGGVHRWAMEDLPLVEEIPSVKKGNFVSSIHEPSSAVKREYVLANLNNPRIVFVDSRSPDFYYGSVWKYWLKGHLPFAVNIPYTDFFRDDKTWRSIDELRDLFESFGITPEKDIIAYCGGNPIATLLYFTLRYVLGYPHVKLYLESLMGWASDSRNLPVWTYGNEYLIKEADWLEWFAGERIQYRVRDPKVRTLDVRSRDQYKAGHIPYSINIPIDELVNSSNPSLELWENIFGSYGIGEDTEVVIYDEQLNRFSVLLFWLMEYFGHRKVSILNGGFAAWVERGYKVTEKETIITKPKHKFDVAISPTSYKIRLQKEKRLDNRYIASDSKRLSRIWLNASKKEECLSRVDPNSDYVYISFEENLDSKGKIKGAGELWKIYKGAGVYKQSEIVCFSYSLYEATFAYFILRLLGYPMIRVVVPEKITSIPRG